MTFLLRDAFEFLNSEALFGQKITVTKIANILSKNIEKYIKTAKILAYGRTSFTIRNLRRKANGNC